MLLEAIFDELKEIGHNTKVLQPPGDGGFVCSIRKNQAKSKAKDKIETWYLVWRKDITDNFTLHLND